MIPKQVYVLMGMKTAFCLDTWSGPMSSNWDIASVAADSHEDAVKLFSSVLPLNKNGYLKIGEVSYCIAEDYDKRVCGSYFDSIKI